MDDDLQASTSKDDPKQKKARMDDVSHSMPLLNSHQSQSMLPTPSRPLFPVPLLSQPVPAFPVPQNTSQRMPLLSSDKSLLSSNISFQLALNPHLYTKQLPEISKPREIGVFSVDDSRNFLDDASYLRFFREPKPGADLTDGFKDRYIRKDDGKLEYLDFFLEWLKLHSKEQNLFATANRIVGWRGLITRIMCLPYESRSDLCISAIRCKGVLYLCEWETEKTLDEKKRQEANEENALNCFTGYRFEGYCTYSGGEKEDKHENHAHVVNTNAAFCTVISCNLARKHNLLLSGEVDCQNPETREYMELKTCGTPTCERQDTSLKKFKLMKWWAQSFLVGIPEIVCGFRSTEGLVENIKVYKTLEIPRIVREGKHWDPSVLLNFLDSFLSFICHHVKEEEETYVFQAISSNPQSRHVAVSKDENGSRRFLPSWYTSFIGASPKAARAHD